MIHKLTNSDFINFQCAVIRWMNYFGMKDIEVYFEFKKLRGVIARFYTSHEGRNVLFQLNTTLRDPLHGTIEEEVQDAAQLNPLVRMARSREFNESNLESEIHAIVHRLQKGMEM